MSALKDYRQEQFARYVAEGVPPPDAYQKAGYAPNADHHSLANRASKLAKLPEVSGRIQEIRDQAASRTSITVARVMEELAKIGFANMMDYMKVQEDGTAYIDLASLDRDKAAAISEIVVDEYMDGRGEDARAVKRIRFKLHDKRAALMDIGKHLGMFKQQVEHSTKDGKPLEVKNKIEVSLLSRDEREMLKQLLLLAAERKRGKDMGLDSPVIEGDYEESDE